MKMPKGAMRMEVYFGDGEVSIASPSFGLSALEGRDRWTVWDRRGVRQGARMVADGLVFSDAVRAAKEAVRRGSKDNGSVFEGAGGAGIEWSEA